MIVFADQQWKFPLALIGCLLWPIDLKAFCIQLAMWLGPMKTFRSMSKLTNLISMQLCGFHCIIWYSTCILVIIPINFDCFFLHYHVVYREFLWPRSTKWVQTLIFQVDIIINSLYIKCSSLFCVFFIFLSNLIIFISFPLIGNDSYHFYSIQCIFTSQLLSPVYNLSFKHSGGTSPRKVLFSVLQPLLIMFKHNGFFLLQLT